MSSSTSTSSSPVRFLRGLLGATAAGCVLAAAVVATVDPWNFLGWNTLGIYTSAEREAKGRLLERAGYDGLLLGSSKVGYIQPSTLPGGRFFNAAFSAAKPEEMLDFLERHARPGMRVLVGLDNFMFNEASFPWSEPKDPGLGTGDLVGYLLGWGKDGHFDPYRYSERRVRVLERLRAPAEERCLALHVFVNPLSTPVIQLLDETPPAIEGTARMMADARRIFPGIVDLSRSDLSERGGFFGRDIYHYRPEVGRRIVERVLAAGPAVAGCAKP